MKHHRKRSPKRSPKRSSKRSPKRKGSKKGSRKGSKKGSRKGKNCMKDGVLVSILKGNCPPDWEEVKNFSTVPIRPFSGTSRLVCLSRDGDKVDVYKKRCPKGYRKSSPKKLKFQKGKKMVDFRFISPRKL